MPSVIPGNFEIVKRAVEGETEALELLVPKAFSLGHTMLMQRFGSGDPTAAVAWDNSFAKAGRTPHGPVTLHLEHERATQRIRARAWGAGATWALDRLAAWVGEADTPEALTELLERHADLPARRILTWTKEVRGLHIGKSPFPGELHTSFALQQRVTFAAAAMSHHALVRRYGEPAPGPLGLWLFPTYAALKAIPRYTLFSLGIDQNRAIALLEAARMANRIQALPSETPLDEIRKLLRAIPRTGVWTAESVLGYGFGDADALPLGDVHLPHMVSFALADEPFTDDDRMVELLEPYRGQRFRVLRILMLAAPRRPYLDKHRGMRQPPRDRGG